jgi:purine-nucleoside phosphorylase
VSYYDSVHAAAEAVRSRTRETPAVAVVLGSGLGDFAYSVANAVAIPYAELPNWPVSQVVGHEGRLVVGQIRGVKVAALAGRSHLYEGHDARTVTFAVRAMGLLGVKTLILTNAAGGISTGLAQGALMAIDDHINLDRAQSACGRERRPVRPPFSRSVGGVLGATAGGGGRGVGRGRPAPGARGLRGLAGSEL